VGVLVITLAKGKPYHDDRLRTSFHQIIGSSQFYPFDAARDNSIESVKRNGLSEKNKSNLW